MTIAPDHTGCVHVLGEVFGEYQCKLCSRMFRENASGVMVTDAPQVAPDFEIDWSGIELGDALVKLEQVRAMVPVLEERRATMGVARKLRGILGERV